jgi:hypothetical protein
MASSSASLGDWAKAGGDARAIAKRIGSRNDINVCRHMAGLDLFRERQYEHIFERFVGWVKTYAKG